MNLRELKKLVLETVAEEKSKARTRSSFNKVIKNTVNKVLAEELNPDVAKNVKLSSVDVEAAKEIVKSGDGDSDKVSVNTSGSWPAKSLYPTQSTMNLGKACHFALGMLNGTMYGSGGPGGDLGAFVATSPQPYLLDGHHRWLATCMVAPDENCGGYGLGMDATDAVAVLNTMTGGIMGHNSGKPGTGDFAQFADVDKILNQLKQTDVPKAETDGKNIEVCEKWAAEEGGGETGEDALAWAAQKMVDNVATCPGASDSSVLLSQGREDMPVADDAEHAGKVGGTPPDGDATSIVVSTLQQGKMDVTESATINRWNKLAGLLKS